MVSLFDFQFNIHCYFGKMSMINLTIYNVKRHCTIFAAKQMSYVIYDDVHSDLYCVLQCWGFMYVLTVSHVHVIIRRVRE
jgi:hypothetical protein